VRLELGIADGEWVVGFVGRLVAEKGLLELFAAMAKIRGRAPVRLLLVGGDDPEKPDGIGLAEARRLGIADLCTFAGVRQDMPAVYGAMDVFVLPSHREGFPRAPMEASAMGVPCVVTDIRGCRQVVTSGRNGFLVPVNSPAALAEAVLRILQDDALARRLGSEGRRRALAEFDERRVFATVLAEYERLLQAKGLGGRIPASLLDPHAARSLVTG
jgi:glycosyltransferase involved in cell wall biosynthesis